MKYISIDRDEALRTAGLLALLLIIAFSNVVFRGESLLPGNAHNSLLPGISTASHGPRARGYDFLVPRNLHGYANVHDPGGPWWQGEPAMELLKRGLRRGEFPLWDPYVGGGAPAAASILPAFFFPPSFLVAVLGNEPWMKNLYILLLCLAAGFFTYVFVRKHDAGVWGARAAGIAFMFSGAVVQTAPGFLGQPVAGIPIALATTAWLLHLPSWRRAIGTGLVYACISLASFPAILIFAFAMVVLYAIVAAPRKLTYFFAAALFAVAFAAFCYLPTLYVIREAVHARLYYAGAGMETAPARQFFQLLSPTLMGGATIYIENAVRVPPNNLFYFGVSGLVVAAATLGRFRPMALLLLLQIVAALLLLKIFGVQPVQQLGRLPLFNSLHIAQYGGILLGFLFACIAGLGVDLHMRRHLLSESAALAVIAIGCAFFVLWNVATGDGVQQHPHGWRWMADYRAALLFFALAAILLFVRTHAASIALVALIAIEGATNARFPREPRWDYWANPPQYVRKMIDQKSLGRVLPLGPLMANTNSPYSIASTDSLLTFNSERYTELHSHFFGSTYWLTLRECKKIPPAPILDAFAVDRVVVSARDTTMVSEALRRGFTKVFLANGILLLTRSSAPRYFLTRDYVVGTRAEVMEQLPQRPSRRLLLEQPPHFPPDPRFAGGTVHVERFGMNSYRLRVSSPAPALLSVSETQMAGWTPTVNGKEVPILNANYAFRAIEVPAGTSVVEFSYWPPGMTAGIAITALAALVAIILAAKEKGSCRKASAASVSALR